MSTERERQKARLMEAYLSLWVTGDVGDRARGQGGDN